METNKLVYSTSNENIKYGTFGNTKMENEIYQEITYEILENDINNFLSNIDSFLTQYEQLLIENNQKYIELCKEFNKKSLYYYIIVYYINKLSKEIHYKLQLQNGSSPAPTAINSFESEIETLITSKPFMKQLVSSQYDNNIQNLAQLFDKKYNNYITIQNSTNKIGIVMLSTTFKYLSIHLNEIIEHLNKFKSLPQFNNTNKLQNEIVLFDFLILLDKLEYYDLTLYNSFFLSENDCFNKQISDSTWNKVKQLLTRITFSNQEQIKTSISTLSEGMGVTNVLITNNFNTNYLALNVVKSSVMLFNHYRNPLQKVWDSKRNELKGAKEGTITKISNLLKNKIVKKAMVARYPSIAFRKKLYLLKEMPTINEEYIKLLIDNINKGIQTKIENKNSINKELYYETISKNEKQFYVSTRLIHSSKITFKNEKPSYLSLSYLQSLFVNTPSENQTKDTLIIHIHGGGFIATPTVVHESYLRKWVNHLNVPLIGIDYSLSPQNKYPKALDDCWQGYNWIINHAEEIFNIKLKKIILSGDSAGGNLSLALVFLLIAHNMRLPDLLLLEYPCCDTNVNNMTPSLLLGLKDKFLRMKFLEFVCECYRSSYKEENDPFLNPEKAGEFLLKKLPKTRYFFGSADPLRDNSLRMLYNIAEIGGIDVKGYDFKDYIHAFYGIGDETMRNPPTEFLLKEVDNFLKEEENKDK